jgi:hypothetical protein
MPSLLQGRFDIEVDGDGDGDKIHLSLVLGMLVSISQEGNMLGGSSRLIVGIGSLLANKTFAVNIDLLTCICVST